MKLKLNKQIITLGLVSSIIFAAPAAFAGDQSNLSLKSFEKISYNNNFFNNSSNSTKLDLNLNKLEFKNSVSPSTTIFGLPNNMGPVDRILRGVIAAGLIGTGAYGLSTGNLNSTLSYTLIGVSAIPIATASSGYCPLYQLFGLDYSF